MKANANHAINQPQVVAKATTEEGVYPVAATSLAPKCVAFWQANRLCDLPNNWAWAVKIFHFGGVTIGGKIFDFPQFQKFGRKVAKFATQI